MDNSIFLLEDQDNVGDVLGKINYNFLKHNNDLFDLETVNKDDFSSLDKINLLMDRMDYLISNVNFDELQDLYTTINFLSSYWNSFEFSVQYPFNPDNGFTSSLVVAGIAGELLGSTLQIEQEAILSDALLAYRLPYIKTADEAKTNLYNNGVIMVNRNDSGAFVSWDFINSSNIFNILVDRSNNLYYNGRLVDIYNVPYYSVITNSDVDILTQGLTPDYESKTILANGGVPLLPEKNNIYNTILIEYQTFVTNDYDVGEGIFVPVTRFVPNVKKLTSIIPANNQTFASKIQSINADLPASYGENTKIHNLAINFLNENYPSVMYPESSIANVVFLLYNTVGQSGETVVETLYWDEETLSQEQRKVEKLDKSNITKIAPGSNTTYNITYTKQNAYIEKIVSVKYQKIVQLKEMVTVVGNIHKVTTLPVSMWKFKGINIGRNYTPNLFSGVDIKQAAISGEPSLIYTG